MLARYKHPYTQGALTNDMYVLYAQEKTRASNSQSKKSPDWTAERWRALPRPRLRACIRGGSAALRSIPGFPTLVLTRDTPKCTQSQRDEDTRT